MTNKKPKKSKIEKVETVKHKVNILKTLTIEERTELFFRICKTRAELKAWIRLFLGLDMPDTTVSRYADTNPLDIIWLIYEICVLEKNPENIEELLCVAGRGSGKCSSKDTKIITQNGPKNIQDIVVNDIVWTGWSWQPVTHTFDEGVKPGVSITTLKGKKNGAFPLTGSLKHRIQALCPKTKKIDWVLMKDLVPGQIVYKTAERVYDNVVDTSSDDYEKGWIIGNITGDGCVSRHGNSISLCGKDDAQILHYRNLVKKHTNSDPSIRLSSHSALIKKVNISSKPFREWHDSYIEGELCYFKKLKTLNHSPSFLAGFISGLMETDGSKDSITFANKELAAQVAQILTIFGVHSVINNSRRPSAITKFEPGHIVTYHETKFNNLPDYMLPLFSKRKTFIEHRQKQNEQFRYPSILIKSFANFIKDKYEIANGYWRLDKTKAKTHSSIKFSKDLWGNSAKGYESYVYGYKIDDFIKLAEKLNETEWITYLRFIRNGYYEEVETVKFGNHYFYDLEIEKDHSYASNGFVSHNTLAVAIAEFVLLFHDQRDVAHVGAILSQAKRCYQYQQGFMLSERVKPILSQSLDGFPVMEKTTQEKSSFNVRDRKTGELVKIDLEVLPCTLKSVNGFHGAFVSVDEIDTVQGEGVRAFQDISGMLDSKRGRKSLRVGISTRKTRYGLMNQQIEDADAQGRTVKKWTVLEFSERCPDERSGTTPTIGYYLQDTMEVISEELWLKKDPKKQEEYSRQEFAGEGCLKCPMAALCLSDAKKQTSKSPMLKPISDAIKKTRENGADWAISQLYNLKPSVEGIVYKEFDEKEHVKDWNQMWFALTNQEFPGQCTHDIFVKKCFSSDTEVLTDKGFIKFPELQKHHLVASLDDNGNLIYEKPTDYIKKFYNGEMVNIYNKIGGHGKQLDLLVTPDHQQTYVRRQDLKNNKIKIHKKTTSELPNGDFCIPAAPLSDGYDQEGIKSPISYMTDDQFYAFLGLWLSEGSMSSVRANTEWRQNGVSVSQYKAEYVERVRTLMTSIKWPSKLRLKKDPEYPHPDAGSWHIVNKELYRYLKPYKFAVNKAIPRDILDKANKHQLSILLDWLLLGDGANYSKNSKQQVYYGTGSKQLANDIQEVAFKLGYRTNLTSKYKREVLYRKDGVTPLLTMYRIQIHLKQRNNKIRNVWYINNGCNKSEYSNSNNKNIETISGYNDYVYCVTMPSGRLFVRRNGVIALSGNCHSMGLDCYAGIDWGWSNPSTVVYFFVDKRENIYVVRCEGRTYINNPTWAQTIKSKWQHMYRCQLYLPDLANPGDAQTMKLEGLPCPTEQIKDTPGGIQVIKKWLKSLASINTKIFFAKETCGPIITEFGLYHFKTDAAGKITDDVEKEHDHWLDALRYAMYHLFGKSSAIIGDDDFDIKNSAFDRNGTYSRMPSPEEFAMSKNIKINPDITQDKSKLGQIGTKFDLDNDGNDDDGVGGNGSFLWSI